MSNSEFETPAIVKTKETKENSLARKKIKTKKALLSKFSTSVSEFDNSPLPKTRSKAPKQNGNTPQSKNSSEINGSSKATKALNGSQSHNSLDKINGTSSGSEPAPIKGNSIDSAKVKENASTNSKVSQRKKKSKRVVQATPEAEVSLTELSKLDPVTYCLGLIKKSLEDNNKAQFESYLLKTTAFVIDKVVVLFDQVVATKFITMLYDVLKTFSGSFKVLKHWTQSVLKHHGRVISQNEEISAVFQKFLSSRDSRSETFNCLSKLSSRLDLILSQRKLMVASRKAELANDLGIVSQSDSEESEPSSGELSLDDQFYLNHTTLNDSDFIEQDGSSSDYETADEGLPTTVNGRLKRKADGSESE